MPTTLDDKVMNGFLIGLGFNNVKSSQEIPTSELHLDLLSDGASSSGDYHTIRDFYEANKKKVSLLRDRTCSGNNVYVDSFTFSKKGAEAGLTFFMNEKKLEYTAHSDQAELEKSIQRTLSKMPKNQKIQLYLHQVYLQLLDYTPPNPH